MIRNYIQLHHITLHCNAMQCNIAHYYITKQFFILLTFRAHCRNCPHCARSSPRADNMEKNPRKQAYLDAYLFIQCQVLPRLVYNGFSYFGQAVPKKDQSPLLFFVVPIFRVQSKPLQGLVIKFAAQNFAFKKLILYFPELSGNLLKL